MSHTSTSRAFAKITAQLSHAGNSIVIVIVIAIVVIILIVIVTVIVIVKRSCNKLLRSCSRRGAPFSRRTLEDYSEVDMMDMWYKSVNLRAPAALSAFSCQVWSTV